MESFFLKGRIYLLIGVLCLSKFSHSFTISRIGQGGSRTHTNTYTYTNTNTNTNTNTLSPQRQWQASYYKPLRKRLPLSFSELHIQAGSLAQHRRSLISLYAKKEKGGREKNGKNDEVAETSRTARAFTRLSELIASFVARLRELYATMKASVTSSAPAELAASFFAGVTLSFLFFFAPPTSDSPNIPDLFRSSPDEQSILAPAGTSASLDQSSKIANQVNIFANILADLSDSYVDPIDTTKIFKFGVKSMLSQLDPYTEFEDTDGAEEMREGIMGRYGGVGIVIGRSDNDRASPSPDSGKLKPVKVVNAFENYAYDAGVRVGDTILTVSGTSTADKKMEEIRALLRGPPGTTVQVEVEREAKGGKIQKTITLARSAVKIRDVKVVSFLDPSGKVDYGDISVDGNSVRKPGRSGIGYVKLSGFTEGAGSEIRQSIEILQRQYNEIANASGDSNKQQRLPLKGLILDLRSNPGGLLTSAVDVASALIPPGEDVVSARGRGFPSLSYKSKSRGVFSSSSNSNVANDNSDPSTGTTTKTMTSTADKSKSGGGNDIGPALYPGTPLIILTNSGTASAAEIVAGCIQDLDLGLIVGDASGRTYGKGLVQNVAELPGKTAMKYTVAKYYTPSGRCIQSVDYSANSEKSESEMGATASGTRARGVKIKKEKQQTFMTKNGRLVKDGGGIESDLSVIQPKASTLEVALLQTNTFDEFTNQYIRTHDPPGHGFKVDEKTFNEFKKFVKEQQATGKIHLEEILIGKSASPDAKADADLNASADRGGRQEGETPSVSSDDDDEVDSDTVVKRAPLEQLRKNLKASGYNVASNEIDQLKAAIVREILNDFDLYKSNIKEDIGNSILSRYLPESMIIEKSLDTDVMVRESVKLLQEGGSYEEKLSRQVVHGTDAKTSNDKSSKLSKWYSLGRSSSTDEMEKNVIDKADDNGEKVRLRLNF